VSITTRPAARRIKPPNKRSVIGAPVFARVPVEVSEDVSADGPDGVRVSALLLGPGDGVGVAPSGVAVGVGSGDDLGDGEGAGDGLGDDLGDGVGLTDGDGLAADSVL
jgi:hypothetical protein